MVLEEELKTILGEVARKLKLEKWLYVQRTLKENIVNYIGNFVSATLIDESVGKETAVVVKRAPRIPLFDDVVTMMYRTEVYVYTTLMPIYKSLNTDLNLEELYPECYFAQDKVLVLKDMGLQGFVRHSNSHLDYEHVSLSLRTVSSFHALSFILTQRKIKVPNSQNLKTFTEDLNFKRKVEYCMLKYSGLFKNSSHEVYLRRLCNSLGKSMHQSIVKVRANIYGHGDLWKENIMFKYCNDKPTAACLVDFQLTRVLSPAQDVLSLIMTGAEVGVRRKWFHQLLSTYYTSLRDTLKRNGVDINILYSQEDFYHDIRTVLPLCLSLIMFSYALWLGLENIQSLIAEEEKEMSRAERETAEMKYKAIVGELIAFFTELGYLTA